MPSQEEIDSGRLGYFDNVRVIEASFAEAQEMLAIEREIADAISSVCSTERDFETVALIVESGRLEEDDDVTAEQAAAIDRYVAVDADDIIPGYLELDLGVGGLVYALAAMGAYPAASCRGHVGGGWSPYPVVYFAVTERLAGRLQPLVAATGCGFGVADERPNLLFIDAPSVENTMSLAERVLADTWPGTLRPPSS